MAPRHDRFPCFLPSEISCSRTEAYLHLLTMGVFNAVLVGRFVFSALCAFMASTVIYTCLTDGSPFRMVILTPWMGATLIDFYINVTVLLTWVYYKEDHWFSRIFWTAGFIGLGSIFTTLYVSVELFKIKTSDPFYFIFLKDRHARLLNHTTLQEQASSVQE